MKAIKLAAAAALLFMLPACSGHDGWAPTPGAPLHVGDTVTTATPPAADCPAKSATTLDGKPVWKVTALPTDTTVTINFGVLPGDAQTVDRTCVTPYASKS